MIGDVCRVFDKMEMGSQGAREKHDGMREGTEVKTESARGS